ncbi:hypothetical protein LMIY3S_01924 [Labrys miyagiensis]
MAKSWLVVATRLGLEPPLIGKLYGPSPRAHPLGQSPKSFSFQNVSGFLKGTCHGMGQGLAGLEW